MTLPSPIPIIAQLTEGFYKTTDFFIRMRYSRAQGLSPLETQYRFATLNYIEFSEVFYEKALQSFVGKKKNKQWLWLAIDSQTRQALAFHVGDRSKKVRASCGKSSQPSIARGPLFTPMGMFPIKASFLQVSIAWSPKRLAGQTISSASTVPCDSGFHDWFERRYRFLKSWTTTSAR